MNPLGEITRCYTMRFERESKHPAKRLWRAITEPAEVAQWMQMPSARVELRVGGEYYVEFTPKEAGALEGVIVRLEPERRLAYVWGESVVEWTIRDEGNTCRYTFVHHGQPPGTVDDEAGIAAGWHAGLDDLANHLDGLPAEEGLERWKQRMPAYRKRIAEVLRL